MASVNDLKNAAPGSLKLFDIRKKPDERQIPGSQRAEGEAIESNPPFGKGDRVILYCGSGNSCSRIAGELQQRGYANVEALDGGYAAWVEAGLPLEDR
ncbi:MAG TPA: rhodanese-like domain-containing protein [Candidatus Baltobacteraceae bacterium]|jgi:rhodanese-related sulfurtransferase|nr:rhodanese-like domain-containing protein [Candidatus Baltobacteraceae bacterium]